MTRTRALRTLLLGSLIGLATSAADAQTPSFAELTATTSGNLEEIAARAEATLGDRDLDSDYRHFKRWEWFVRPRVYPSGKLFNIAARNWLEYHRYLALRPAALAASGGSGAWTALGPDTYNLGASGYSAGIGRVNVIAYAGSTLYVGTPSGGLWTSTDSGASWRALTDGLPSLGVSGIAIDPSGTIYILTGDGNGKDLPSIGVLKSTDGGKTWLATGLSWNVNETVYGYKLAIDPSNPKNLFAATTLGFWRSTDAGASWQSTLAGTIYDFVLKPNTPATLYAASEEGKFFRIFRSTDGGATWSQVTSGLPTLPEEVCERIALAVTAADSNRVYALYGGPQGFLGLYSSTDGGTTFSLRSSTPNLLGLSKEGSDEKSQAWYDLALAASPSNANQVYVGGVNTWKSLDGGTTWSNTSYWIQTDAGSQYTHADIHALVFQGITLYCASDGGIFRTIDDGASWASISTKLQVMQLYRVCLGGGALFLGAQDNGSNQLTSTVATQVYGGDGGQCQVDARDPRLVYVTTQEGKLRKSTKGGEEWSVVTPADAGSGAWVTPYQMLPTNSSSLFAGYVDLWKTTDGAQRWSNLTNGKIGENKKDTSIQVAVAPSANDTIYVLKLHAIYVSRDGGTTWTKQTGLPLASAEATNLAVSLVNPNIAWVTFSGYVSGTKVFKTTDAGAHWWNISGSLPNLPVSAVAAQNSAGGVYVGMDVGVYYRDDSMNDWVQFSNGLPSVIVDDLRIDEGDGQIYAASFGRGVWRSPMAGACPATIALTNADPKPVVLTSYRASDSVTSSMAMTDSLATNVSYQAGGTITLQPGFEVRAGGTFRATIAACNRANGAPAPFQPTSFRGDVEALFAAH